MSNLRSLTALESIFNYVFYVVLACVILWILDIDPFALFLSLSSIILAFAFMIGSASAKYFEVCNSLSGHFKNPIAIPTNIIACLSLGSTLDCRSAPLRNW